MKTYPHEKLNSLKSIIRKGKLSLAKQEERNHPEESKGSMITIRRGGEVITITHILTFNKVIILTQVKIGYCLQSTKKVHSKDLDLMEEDCFNKNKF